MIFLNKNILIILIKNISVESSYKYINYLGFDISKDQIELVLPILKNNITYLYNNDIDSLLNKLPKNVTKSTKEQLVKLFNQYIKKEG